METNEQDNYEDQSYNYDDREESFDVNEVIKTSSLVEVKVSDDGGETWTRRKINMADGLDESGLSAGEIFVFNDEKFRVLEGDDGLRVEKLQMTSGKKKPGRK